MAATSNCVLPNPGPATTVMTRFARRAASFDVRRGLSINRSDGEGA